MKEDSIGIYTKRTRENFEYYDGAIFVSERLTALNGDEDFQPTVEIDRESNGYSAYVEGAPDGLGEKHYATTPKAAVFLLAATLGEQGRAEVVRARSKAQATLSVFERAVRLLEREVKAAHEEKAKPSSERGHWTFEIDQASLEVGRRLAIFKGPDEWNLYGEWTAYVPDNLEGVRGGVIFRNGAVIGDTFPGGMVHSFEMSSTTILTAGQVRDVHLATGRSLAFAAKLAKFMTRTAQDSNAWLRRFY